MLFVRVQLKHPSDPFRRSGVVFCKAAWTVLTAKRLAEIGAEGVERIETDPAFEVIRY